jgi:hypothetical protein
MKTPLKDPPMITRDQKDVTKGIEEAADLAKVILRK